MPSSDRNLIVFMPGIGNAVLLTPMLRALKMHEPDNKIDMIVTQKVVKDLLEPEDLVDRFILYNNDKEKRIFLNRFSPYVLMWRILTTFYNQAFIMGSGNKKLLLFSALLRARRKLGYSKSEHISGIARKVYDNVVFLRRGVGECETNLDSLRSLGWDVPCMSPKLTLSSREIENGQQIIANTGQGKPVIGIHPGCSAALSFKRWPVENFAKVSHHIYYNHDIQPVLFGGPGEECIAEQIRKKASFKIPSFAGILSIRESVSVIGACNYFLSNDSGLMHVASALNIPQLALFGDTDTNKNYPQSNVARVIDGKAIAGGIYPAINNITVELVIENLEDLFRLSR